MMFKLILVLTQLFALRHRGKGFLAADESAGPWLRARHAEAAKIPDTKRQSITGVMGLIFI